MHLRLYILIALLYIPSILMGQIDPLLHRLEHYYTAKVPEKVHLHFDKENYAAGENIWFKLYCVTAPFNELTRISKVAYIDLISPQDKIVQQIKIPLTLGLGIGDFALSDTLVEGSYRIRAYTNWMRNDSSAYFFERIIPITNGRSDNVITKSTLIKGSENNNFQINLKTIAGAPIINKSINYTLIGTDGKSKSGRVKSNDQGDITIALKDDFKGGRVELQFSSTEERRIVKNFTIPDPNLQNSLQVFPEGGELVSNLLSKVAFKTLSYSGMGVKAKISLYDDQAVEMISLETNDLGMGSIPLILKAGTKYTAKATFSDGQTTTIVMPEVHQSGYVISVNNNLDGKIVAQLSASEELVKQQDVYLVAQYQGLVLYMGRQKLKAQDILFQIPTADLPSGILQLTVISDQLIPLAERLVFNFSPTQMLPLTLSFNKPTFKTRDKVAVHLQIQKGETDTLTFAALSAAVINTNKSTAPEVGILSELLLKSDLRGFIEKPDYYFNDPQHIKKEELDNLMMTQGWRRLDWRTYQQDTIIHYKPEAGISLSGTIKKLGRKAVVAKAKVTLVPTTNMMLSVDTLSDANGNFRFDDMFFADSIKFIVTARGEKEKNRVDIDIDEETIPPIRQPKDSPLRTNDINTQYFKTLKESQDFFAELERSGLKEKSIRLEEATVTRVQQNKNLASSRNLNGPGRADQVITAEELSTCATLEQCLAGRLLGVMFQNGVPYSTRSMGSGQPMQVVLDGMYIEPDQISMINVQDVASIEVLRSAGNTAIYGSYGANGLLIITSKTGDARMSSYTPTGIITILPKGYHVNRTFFKPDYETPQPQEMRRDLRSTLAWEPNLVTNKEGKTDFFFFTSDEPGPYKITVEGITPTGKIIHQEHLIDVTP